MRIVFLGLIFCAASVSFAQKTVDVGKSAGGIEAGTYFAVGNTPFVNTKYVNLIEGTPYLSEQWMKGAVRVRSGQRYSGSPLRYDLVNNKLHFLAKDDIELVSNIEPVEMWLEDTITLQQYHFLHSSVIPAQNLDKHAWYQLLDSGKVQLYKTYHKLYSESLPYNSSIHEQRIITREKYYLSNNNVLVLLKDLKSLPNTLADKRKELEAYLRDQDDKKASLHERWKKIIHYYNSL